MGVRGAVGEALTSQRTWWTEGRSTTHRRSSLSDRSGRKYSGLKTAFKRSRKPRKVNDWSMRRAYCSLILVIEKNQPLRVNLAAEVYSWVLMINFKEHAGRDTTTSAVNGLEFLL